MLKPENDTGALCCSFGKDYCNWGDDTGIHIRPIIVRVEWNVNMRVLLRA